jgi:hypothetical protein
LIIAVFCWIDEALPAILAGERLRQRGPQPVLDDREVLTMEVFGQYLGVAQDTALFAYFRRHWAHFFPALRCVHRTTFVRQAANLSTVKERLWQHALAQIPHDPTFALIDSFALPVCQFARACRCQRFAEEAAYGYDHLTRHTFCGLRFHARLCWPGVITEFELAPANVAELEVAADLADGTLLGDRNYWSLRLRAELAQRGIELVAPPTARPNAIRTRAGAGCSAAFATASTRSSANWSSAVPSSGSGHATADIWPIGCCAKS